MPAKEKNAIECSDSALMLLFSDGEIDGFQHLYDKHKHSIYQFFFYGSNGDQALSCELFEDVWMTIVRGRKRFTKDICFVDWLRHVAWARLYDHLRMFPTARQPVLDSTSVDTNILSLPKRSSRIPTGMLTGHDSGVLTTLQSLSDEQCEIVLLRYCFKMELSEIASFLDIARTSVNLLHKEALVSLRRTLQEAV